MSTTNDTLSNHNVHGWLMDVPGYRENYQNERQHSLSGSNLDETRHSKERPSSLLSISSEDSINLDELINANFTTDMDDETDLPDLSSLDLLDDSNEDFWKMDNFLNQLMIPSRGKYNSNNRSTNYDLTSSEDDDFLFDSNNTSLDDLLEQDSFYSHNDNGVKKAMEHDFLNSLNFDRDTQKPKLLQVPTSLPLSPKSLTSSPTTPEQQRINRSNSISSENSLNSLSTITQRHIHPTASTSTTSSIGSRSTTTNCNTYLPRSSSTRTNDSNSRMSQPRTTTSSRQPPPTSMSETITSTLLPSRSISHIGLARRATHIPAPSPPSTKKSLLLTTSSTTSNTAIITPTRTKSTNTLAHKKSTSSLTRSASRIGQPTTNRASHIPTPPTRSTTSLGISSIFSSSSSSTTSPTKQRLQPQSTFISRDERPKTSMGVKMSSTASVTGLRRAPSTMIPSSSKSTSLRRMQSTSAASHTVYSNK